MRMADAKTTINYVYRTTSISEEIPWQDLTVRYYRKQQ